MSTDERLNVPSANPIHIVPPEQHLERQGTESQSTRRRVLQGAISLAALAATAAPLSMVPLDEANADPVTIALAAAAFIIQLIASANRSDGGIGATLGAINNKLDITIHQLSVIESSLEFVISKLAELKEDLANALSEQYAMVLRNKILSQTQKLKDKLLAAEKAGVSLDGISLTDANDEQRQYLRAIATIYNNFDDARRELWSAEESTTTIAAQLTAINIAVDGIAYSFGIISDQDIEISFDHQIQQISSMNDPNLKRSIRSTINASIVEENNIIDGATKTNAVLAAVFNRKSADNTIQVSYDSFDTATVRGCVRVITRLSGIDDHYQDITLADVETDLVFEVTRYINPSGSVDIELLGMFTDLDLSVAYYQPQYILKYNSGDNAVSINYPCITVVRPKYVLSQDQTQAYLADPGIALPEVWNDALLAEPWATYKLSDYWEKTNAVIAKINTERLKRIYANACLDYAVFNMEIARHIKAGIPL